MIKNKGFTLLELVVVVAIIGLLASVALIPNLIRFQQRAAASKINSVVAQIASAYELTAAEGCTSVTITLGSSMTCTAPISQVLIQSLPLNPGSGPAIDIDSTCDPAAFTTILTQNPSTTALNFCARRYLAGTGNFVCNQGSCGCTVSGDCQR